MRIRIAHACLVAAALTPAFALAQTRSPAVNERVERIDEYASRLHGLGAFSGVVYIAQGDEVLLSKSYGFADDDSRRTWTPDTVSTIGSITKQFTGAAIMLLAQEGRLELTDTLADHFDGVPNDKAGVTIHQLLTHSAGFRGAIGPDETYIGRDAYLARAWESDLLFEPGERYEYSNVGYSIAGAIIEVVSGQTYEAFLRERLWLPAGMRDTGYLAPDWAPERIATGYRNGQRWGTVIERQTQDEFSWHLTGNGGLHSTARDMHKWWLAIRDNTILNAEATETYLAPHQDEGRGDSFYGYGWVNFEAPDGQRLLAHNGGNGIFFADCAYFPETDIFALVMINDAPAAQGDSMAAFLSVAGGELRLPPDPTSADVDALRAAAQHRAEAFIEASNAGPDAYVQYGFDHRIDQGADEDLNAERRRAAISFADRFGRLEIVSDAASVLGEHHVVTRASTTGQRVTVEVRVSAEPPHLVERVALDIGPEPDVTPLEGTSLGALIDRSRELNDDGATDASIRIARLATERYPDDGEAWFWLGTVQLLANLNDESVAPLETALEKGFESGITHYNLACAHAKQGRTDTALGHLEAAASAGFGDARQYTSDPDLKSLRDQARFKALLRKGGE